MEEKLNMEEKLKELNNDPSCLTDSSYQIKMNDANLSNITKIYLKNSQQHLPQLLQLLPLQLNSITTIILEKFVLKDLISLFEKLDFKKITTLVLIHKTLTFSDKSEILGLLEKINEMSNLVYFEFSNFKIDLSVSKEGYNNTCVELFTGILEKNSLTFFYFDNNFFFKFC